MHIASFCEGEVSFADKTQSRRLHVLMDTGATSANYISKTCLDEMRSSLGKGKVKPMKGVVTLGDSQTKIQIEEAVHLNISLFDPERERHEADCVFQVMETGHDLVIGLPTIMRSFIPLLASLLEHGKERLPATPPEHSLFQSINSDELNMIKDSINKLEGILSIQAAIAYDRETREKYLHPKEQYKLDQMCKQRSPKSELMKDLQRKLPDVDYVLRDSSSFNSTILIDGEKPSADMTPAWSKETEIAEELEELYEPMQMQDAFNMLSKPRNERIDEYKKLLPEKMSSQCSPRLIELLMAEEIIEIFAPTDWIGMSFDPLELDFLDSLTENFRTANNARHVNPRLMEHAYKEFRRLMGYMYQYSTSPVASPLHIAPKATPPYIRFCGDYTQLNRYIRCHHGYTPMIKHLITKIYGYKVFAEIDLTNAFHQIRIGDETSAKLSIQTPWGQVQPKFMPEGVAPASIYLQDKMREIFHDMPTVIYMWDNILVLGEDQENLVDNLIPFFERCRKYNLKLKMAKSTFGFEQVSFFGYDVRHNSYSLGEDRKETLRNIKFPTSLKGMQSFLGMAVFFNTHVPGYANLVAPLYDMTKKDFDWNNMTEQARLKYVAVFNNAKSKILEAQSLFYPDYSLRWRLQTDACNTGYGGVLIQMRPQEDGNETPEPIAYISKKFSTRAAEWDTHKQESYAIYYCVKKLQYLLRGKYFELETDHRNLQWMEKSEDPVIIRIRAYLQTFIKVIRHISAAKNKVADYLSREDFTVNHLSYMLNKQQYIDFESRHSDFNGSDPITPFLKILTCRNFPKINPGERVGSSCNSALHADDDQLYSFTPTNQESDEASKADEKIQEACKSVHNGRVGHGGAARTWRLLNTHYPGHQIPFKLVQEFVMTCPICIKTRIKAANTIPPMYRTIKTRNKAIGIDHTSVTPADTSEGYDHLTVIVDLVTGMTRMYPRKELSAEGTAECVIDFIVTYGLYTEWHTDPGSDFTSDVMRLVTKYLGLEAHVVSLVDRHESNGVERVIKEVLRHLSALVNEERIRTRWAKKTTIKCIEFILNNSQLSEKGMYTAYTLMYGTGNGASDILQSILRGEANQAWPQLLKDLDEEIRYVQEVSWKYQQKIIEERKEGQQSKNKYAKGDLILHLPKKFIKHDKLNPKHTGPFKVVKQTKNDITCIHLADPTIVKEYHVSEVALWVGTDLEAEEAARWDNDVYVVTKVLAHRGNIYVKTHMEFLLEYKDGEKVWMPYGKRKDMIDSTLEALQIYCVHTPELYTFCMNDRVARKYIRENMRKLDEIDIKKGDIFYLDIRWYSWVKDGAERNTWFQDLALPDKDISIYVSKCEAGEKVNGGKQVKIYDITLGDELLFNSYDLLRFAYRKEVGNCVLVDQQMVDRYKMNSLQNVSRISENDVEEEDDKYYEKVMEMEVSHLI